MNKSLEDKDTIVKEENIVDLKEEYINDTDEDEIKQGENSDKMIKKNTFIIIATILVCIMISIGIGYVYVRSKIYIGNKPVNSTQVEIETASSNEKDIEYREVEGITNVLLIGADGGEEDGTPGSDSMIIATLDNNNNKVKLTSLYRDTLVKIPGHGQNKINAAFKLGGADLLLKTIKETYNINIDKYVIIDFSGFESVIDYIGGIEVDVKDYQIEELNKYIGDGTSGNDCPVTKTGIQVLNGKQTLSYARIRKNVGDDYERTERQREVLFKVAEKLKDTKPTKYFGIMNSTLNYIEMNIEPIEVLNMAYTIYKFPSLETEQISIPVQELVVDKEIIGVGSVLIMDKNENTKIMHEFIFENKKIVINNTEY